MENIKKFNEFINEGVGQYKSFGKVEVGDTVVDVLEFNDFDTGVVLAKGNLQDVQSGDLEKYDEFGMWSLDFIKEMLRDKQITKKTGFVAIEMDFGGIGVYSYNKYGVLAPK